MPAACQFYAHFPVPCTIMLHHAGLWAVMGPSGSGKSTLLNTLAMRLDPGMKLKGDLRLNGRPYSHSELKMMSGYVMQDDMLNGNLKVEETLDYMARLRCSPKMSAAQREQVGRGSVHTHAASTGAVVVLGNWQACYVAHVPSMGHR